MSSHIQYTNTVEDCGLKTTTIIWAHDLIIVQPFQLGLKKNFKNLTKRQGEDLPGTF